MTAPGARPRPVADDLTRPFWAAADEHRLCVQHCRGCGWYSHPPTPQCRRCSSIEMEWWQMTGFGSIHAFTIVRSDAVQGFEVDTPYVGVLVELDEQEGLLIPGNLVGELAQAVEVGQRVEVAFEARSDLTLPVFRLAVQRC